MGKFIKGTTGFGKDMSLVNFSLKTEHSRGNGLYWLLISLSSPPRDPSLLPVMPISANGTAIHKPESLPSHPLCHLLIQFLCLQNIVGSTSKTLLLLSLVLSAQAPTGCVPPGQTPFCGSPDTASYTACRTTLWKSAFHIGAWQMLCLL